MINDALINPASIVVVGGSNDISKPGGKVLKNILVGKYGGKLYVVNPKMDNVQGVRAYRDVSLMPPVDLAILAIPSGMCLPAVRMLAEEKSTKAFIILSAGFGEESAEGKALEKQLVKIIDKYDGCLIGPNCIGFMNSNYNGVFTTPLPGMDRRGADLISGSGATAVFIMESAIPNGLIFSSVFSVGNSAQVGVEDVLEYLDLNFREGESSTIKLLYIESVEKPAKLLKHAISLIRKGCRIAAVKAGSTEAGSRAASSHTGALSSSDRAVDALFRKAGIVRCFSRSELTAVASLFMLPLPAGKRLAIITHAGGPAVMMSDALSKEGIEIPPFTGQAAENLREKLYPGSSVSNPVDFLATGTASQLGEIIDAFEKDFEDIDAMAVIFGSPGLIPVSDVYNLLEKKIHSCTKPIYPVIPSVINAKEEIEEFVRRGNVFFPDEVVFAGALTKILNTPGPDDGNPETVKVDTGKIRSVIDSSPYGYLDPIPTARLLDASGIKRVREEYACSLTELTEITDSTGFPVVMKIAGPLHKTDVGGVVLNIGDPGTAVKEYTRMSQIPGFKGVIIQEMVSGLELFAGVKNEGPFGHILMAGMGGVLVEVMKDFSAELIPVSAKSAIRMIHSLKGYDIIKGVRGRKGVNESLFVDIICRLSALIEAAPEIMEVDLNPLIGSGDMIIAVDARIRIEKTK